MARFLKHTSCPQCGSSDAKGIYDDGSSFCFSCQHSSRGVLSALRSSPLEGGTRTVRPPPDDRSVHFSSDAMGWLNKSGISVETLLSNNVRFSPSRNQIVFTWPNTDVWQARNCSVEARGRYFTSGNHENVLVLYYGPQPASRCVLTEDCLSAIKITSICDTMPLLGSHLQSTKMKALKRLYPRVDVFLDEDKYKEAIKISNKLKLLGIQSKTYLDVRDPKHIPYDELKDILNG